jgi:hypothetical protein
MTGQLLEEYGDLGVAHLRIPFVGRKLPIIRNKETLLQVLRVEHRVNRFLVRKRLIRRRVLRGVGRGNFNHLSNYDGFFRSVPAAPRNRRF